MEYTKEYLIERLDKMLLFYNRYNKYYKLSINNTLNDNNHYYDCEEVYYLGYHDSKIDSYLSLYEGVKLEYYSFVLNYDLLLYLYNNIIDNFEYSNLNCFNILDEGRVDASLKQELKEIFSRI
jgi:hypothetical protein